MWRVVAIVPVCIACSFNPLSGNSDDDDTPPVDARDGDMGEGTPIDARQCFGEGNYEVCIQGITPVPPLDLPATLSTDNAPCLALVPGSFWAKTTGQPDSCVIVAESINVPATTTVTGSRPLVLVAGTITVAGSLDLSSKQGVSDLGPAANSGQCVAPTPPGGAAAGGGGPGGSFQSAGGNGGNGNGGTGSSASPAVTAPNILRGGCAGTKGASALAGDAGASGGVAYLVASTSITITGRINASGAGGEPGGLLSGGSGGGSGGMLVLWAPAIDVSEGRLVANGGGGSSGADDNTVGDAGSDPEPETPGVQADGGSSSSRGGAGGRGYATPTVATGGGLGDALNEGGGGGGGGGGFIRSNQPLTGMISPPAIP
jgi:hypothetical protein